MERCITVFRYGVDVRARGSEQLHHPCAAADSSQMQGRPIICPGRFEVRPRSQQNVRCIGAVVCGSSMKWNPPELVRSIGVSAFRNFSANGVAVVLNHRLNERVQRWQLPFLFLRWYVGFYVLPLAQMQITVEIRPSIHLSCCSEVKRPQLKAFHTSLLTAPLKPTAGLNGHPHALLSGVSRATRPSIAARLPVVLLPVIVLAIRRWTGTARAPYIAGAILMAISALYSFLGHKKFSFKPVE